MESSNERRAPVWLRVVFGCGLVLCLAGAVLFFVRYRVYVVPSPSMVPTLQVGDRMIADTWDRSPKAGDLVVFNARDWGAQAAASTEVKRVLAVAGDSVSCCSVGGQLGVNGQAVPEPYLNQVPGQPTVASATPFTAHVPAGRVFLLGDNRNASLDSRAQLQNQSGTIAESDIQSKVVAVGLPLERLSFVGGVGPGNFFSLLVLGTAAGVAAALLSGLALLVLWAGQFVVRRPAGR